MSILPDFSCLIYEVTSQWGIQNQPSEFRMATCKLYVYVHDELHTIYTIQLHTPKGQ